MNTESQMTLADYLKTDPAYLAPRPPTVYWYSVEEVRAGFLATMKQCPNVSNACAALNITLDTLSKIRNRRLNIPPKAVEKAGLYKVVQGPHRVIGYVSKELLKWETFWL